MQVHLEHDNHDHHNHHNNHNNQPEPLSNHNSHFIYKMVQVKTLDQGQYFGELALMNNRPRLASIVATTHTVLAVLHKVHFNSILKRLEEQRQMKEMSFFAELPLFSEYNTNLIRFIYLNSFKFIYNRGQIVFREDEDVEYFYIVKSGDFEVYNIIITSSFKRGSTNKCLLMKIPEYNPYNQRRSSRPTDTYRTL